MRRSYPGGREADSTSACQIETRLNLVRHHSASNDFVVSLGVKPRQNNLGSSRKIIDGKIMGRTVQGLQDAPSPQPRMADAAVFRQALGFCPRHFRTGERSWKAELKTQYVCRCSCLLNLGCTDDDRSESESQMPYAIFVFLQDLVVVIISAGVAADENLRCVPEGERVLDAAGNDRVHDERAGNG